MIKPLIQMIGRLFAASGNGRRLSSSPAVSNTPSPIKRREDPLLDSLAQARTYQRQIEAMARTATSGSLEQLRLEQLSERVREWVQTIEALVACTLNQREDELLAIEKNVCQLPLSGWKNS